jgi:hypothetical protein
MVSALLSNGSVKNLNNRDTVLYGVHAATVAKQRLGKRLSTEVVFRRVRAKVVLISDDGRKGGTCSKFIAYGVSIQIIVLMEPNNNSIQFVFIYVQT